MLSIVYSYALIATATDYDSWRPNTEAVTAAEVFKTLKRNADVSRHVTVSIIEELHSAAEDGSILSEEADCMRFAIMPRDEAHSKEDENKLNFVLPTYFPAL